VVTYRDFVSAFRDLELGRKSRILVHASLSAFGPVRGGAEAVVGALQATSELILVPTFTYQTMVTPQVGPKGNAVRYGASGDQSAHAEFFAPDLPSHSSMGVVAEALRAHGAARRSSHPILSFAGIKADEALEAQSLEDPLGPIRWLADQDGDVVLMGVDHRSNTSLHLAEQLAGRKQFVRWALTPAGVVECPGIPGCSEGFQAIAPRLEGVSRTASLGNGAIELIPTRDLIHAATSWIRENPLALLCNRVACQRCEAVRESLRMMPKEGGADND
jgi:aminoglycoside 3-N-acetyltransferase